MAKNKLGIFVTGTDTDVGKTYISEALIKHFCRQGFQTVGMKPIAAGAEIENGRLLNADVKAIVSASNVDAPIDQINPYVFAPAIAPHIAAQQAGIEIEIEPIMSAFKVLQQQADVIVVEGAGGFLVPINETLTMGDLAKALDVGVVLVVGVRLGCISHALLTVQSIEAKGLHLIGWVANRIEANMPALEENIATLKAMIKAPCVADVAWNEEPSFSQI
jgi:dethiobiotin synthetase